MNPTTGARSILTDFNDATKGPVAGDPHGIALEATGRVLVVDPTVGTNGRGAPFRVNQSTGVRTLLSNFGDASQSP